MPVQKAVKRNVDAMVLRNFTFPPPHHDRPSLREGETAHIHAVPEIIEAWEKGGYIKVLRDRRRITKDGQKCHSAI